MASAAGVCIISPSDAFFPPTPPHVAAADDCRRPLRGAGCALTPLRLASASVSGFGLSGDGSRPGNMPVPAVCIIDPDQGAAWKKGRAWLLGAARSVGAFLASPSPLRIFGETPAGALCVASFHAAFREKGRLSSFLAPIPVYVVKAADAGLRGTVVALSATVPATS